MILIDTNVISELMREAPAPAVLAWFDRRTVEELYLSAVSEAELRTGAAILPAGRRRDRLVAALDAMIVQDFSGRVLAFDSIAARSYAEIAAARRSAGRPILEADCCYRPRPPGCGFDAKRDRFHRLPNRGDKPLECQ
jgi:predicted nucleic acid-binding protein